MENLSAEIFAQVSVITEAVSRLKTDQPSFENGIPREILVDADAAAARQKVLALTDELHALLSDPEQLLVAQTNPTISSNAICQLGLVKTLPIESTGRRIEDIANEAKLPLGLAKRLMKHAVAHRIYSEPTSGFFCHTAASKILAADEDCQKWLCSAVDEVIPSSYKIPNAIRKWDASGKPSHAGWNVEHTSSNSFFDELAVLPERAENFAASMRFFSKHPGFHMRHLFAAFDWHSLSGKTLTDVGGSVGHASIYLAEQVPSLRCVIQDRPEVVELFKNSVPSNLAGRVSHEAHDMFQDQPRLSDAFLLRLILHDWSETYARKIIKALIPGMTDGTKILIQEMIIPSHGASVSLYHQKIMRGFDLNLLGLQNGQERDFEEWQDLISQADTRFHLTNVYCNPESIFGLLEYTWQSL